MRTVVSLHKLFNYAARLTVNPTSSDVKNGVITEGYPNPQHAPKNLVVLIKNNLLSLLQTSSL
jgi:hypothetical protein